MTKTKYVVSLNYCSNRLGLVKSFLKYSDAFNFAIKAKQDADNTNIAIKEITISGIFKKQCTIKIISIYNEE